MKSDLTVLQHIHRFLLFHKARLLGLASLVTWNPEWKRSILTEWDRWVEAAPDRLFLRFEDRRWTYGETNRIANRHAHAYQALGVKRGDVVALMMTNRPEFLFHYLGIIKLGAVASLINPDLHSRSLAHAVGSCKAVRLTLGIECLETVKTIAAEWPDLKGRIDVEPDVGRPLPGELPFNPWAPRLEGQPESDLPETAEISMSDVAAYVYTSGTTGLPKPAIVKHHRLWRAGRAFGGLAFSMSRYENLYLCLPLYHGNAILIAVPSAIMWGGSLTIARKFSVHHFWEDIRKYRCTRFIYIGELLRYLLNQPPSPKDKDHFVTRIEGNGLRPEIWDAFVERFGIKAINEHYAATEGNVETFNMLGFSGTVGPIMPWKMRLARWDFDKEDFVRDAKGRLVKCKIGEAGVMMGKILPKNEFVGYTNKEQTESKIIRDAFQKGDAWFNTGDVLRLGWNFQLSFVDRLGDTFRWKGQNISTQEVAGELNRLNQIVESTVYGVQIPGLDGRAGMAAVVLANGKPLEGREVYRRVSELLPSYSAPVFVRILPAIDVTSTFKHDKKQLRKEGYDLTQIKDPVYYRDTESSSYLPLTAELCRKIEAGQIKV